ncbi:MAG: hypothetical protein R2694_20820, partial [Ilumatobacteraceae bacterium]
EQGSVRSQFCHAVDLAATVLDLTGAPVPAEFNGRSQMPLHGASILPTFADGAAAAPRGVQYFEQMGHRGIYVDGWKATTYHEPGVPFDDDVWGLYDLTSDFSECHDLGPTNPEKLAEMVAAWWAEADTHGVLPLDERTIELFGGAPRPGTPHHFAPGQPAEYVYRPPMAHLPSDVSPTLGGRNWEVVAEVTVPAGAAGAEGVLYSRGTHSVGHCWWVQDGQMHFHYNALGRPTRATGPVTLPPGRHTLTARFLREGSGGTISLWCDGVEVGSALVPKVVRMLGSIGTDIARGPVNAVVGDFQGAFPFTAEVHTVTFRTLGRQPAADAAKDLDATARTELSRE